MTWIRARFLANGDDWRPVNWPPPGPCWCTGYAADGSYSSVVAFVRTEEQIYENWPEAWDVSMQGCEEITFTDRFQRPDWWDEKP